MSITAGEARAGDSQHAEMTDALGEREAWKIRDSSMIGRDLRTQAARCSRFREGVLASLKLKMELSPMAEYMTPKVPDFSIVLIAWHLPLTMSSHLHKSFCIIASESKSQTRTHTTTRPARLPTPPCSLARYLNARRTRTCCRTQHPFQAVALAFVSYGFV
jgi:hypothetical protein